MSTAPAKAAPLPGLYAERYDLIDAWRGLAALAVVVHHVCLVLIGGPAVMLFFVISGYCIAASVDSCQRKGLGFGTFMLRRVRRIYPPYLLALAYWGGTRWLKARMTGTNDLAGRTAVEWLQNLTLTQWVSLVPHPEVYAPNNKALFVPVFWSLCYEEQFYLIMGLMMIVTAALGGSVLTMTAGLLVAGVAWNAFYPELSFGFFLEYWALFAFGVLVFHRLCRLKTPGQRRAVDVTLVAALGLGLFMRYFFGRHWLNDEPIKDVHDPENRNAWGEIAMASGFALVLIYTRPWAEKIAGYRLFRPFAALGMITFSLYLIHQPSLGLVERGVNSVLSKVPGHLPAWVSLVVQMAVHVGLASVFWYFCERPFLNKSLLPVERTPTKPQGAG